MGKREEDEYGDVEAMEVAEKDRVSPDVRKKMRDEDVVNEESREKTR